MHEKGPQIALDPLRMACFGRFFLTPCLTTTHSQKNHIFVDILTRSMKKLLSHADKSPRGSEAPSLPWAEYQRAKRKAFLNCYTSYSFTPSIKHKERGTGISPLLHFHLLLSTPDGNPSGFMRHFNISYRAAFNRRHGRVGHLSQGRYKAFLIDADKFFWRYLATST
jgi:hypothetical protein